MDLSSSGSAHVRESTDKQLQRYTHDHMHTKAHAGRLAPGIPNYATGHWFNATYLRSPSPTAGSFTVQYSMHVR